MTISLIVTKMLLALTFLYNVLQAHCACHPNPFYTIASAIQRLSWKYLNITMNIHPIWTDKMPKESA